jgi:hypothetical protein
VLRVDAGFFAVEGADREASVNSYLAETYQPPAYPKTLFYSVDPLTHFLGAV